MVRPFLQRTFGQNNKNIKPTFGVSFGLPQQNGYPINPYGPNPLVNPFGGTFGGTGINLGLVSVNPLISVQVTKDDYGEKIIKPFVNLHVTPNDYLLHKANKFFSYKKGLILNNHYHHHSHQKPHFTYGPGYGHYHGPFQKPQGPIYHEPEYFEHNSRPEIYLDHPPFPVHDKPHFHERPQFEHYEDSSYDGAFFGRHLNYSDGNYLSDQYQQQYNEGDNYYQNNRNSRFDKKINSVKFPTSRRRRDLTTNENINVVKTKVCL